MQEGATGNARNGRAWDAGKRKGSGEFGKSGGIAPQGPKGIEIVSVVVPIALCFMAHQAGLGGMYNKEKGNERKGPCLQHTFKGHVIMNLDISSWVFQKKRSI